MSTTSPAPTSRRSSIWLAGGASLVANCGYGHGFSVREVLDTARRVTGVAFPIEEGPRRPGDPADPGRRQPPAPGAARLGAAPRRPRLHRRHRLALGAAAARRAATGRRPADADPHARSRPLALLPGCGSCWDRRPAQLPPLPDVSPPAPAAASPPAATQRSDGRRSAGPDRHARERAGARRAVGQAQGARCGRGTGRARGRADYLARLLDSLNDEIGPALRAARRGAGRAGPLDRGGAGAAPLALDAS